MNVMKRYAKFAALWSLCAGAVLALGGCAPQSEALDLAETAASGGGVGLATAAKAATSASTAKGLLMAHTAGAQALLNPAVALSTGAAMAQTQINARRNQAAAAKVAALVSQDSRLERGLKGMLVQAYNQENGTHYRSYQEIQDHLWIESYNESFGTSFKNLSQCRRDYNRRKGTHFKTDKAFRQAIRDGKI